MVLDTAKIRLRAILLAIDTHRLGKEEMACQARGTRGRGALGDRVNKQGAMGSRFCGNSKVGSPLSFPQDDLSALFE